MKVLILGGIAESKELAKEMISRKFEVIYSIAGLVRQPQLDCEIHSGGFSDEEKNGIHGMTEYVVQKQIDMIIDATHPYAVEISANATTAAKMSGVSCWRFSRPGWNLDLYKNWRYFSSWEDLMGKIAAYKRPFFSIGRSALDQVYRQPESQHWVVRSAVEPSPINNVTVITAIGPFSYEDEAVLLKHYCIDALITKDSGCQRVEKKMQAASDLGIPIYIQPRPDLEEADRVFDDVESLVLALSDSDDTDKVIC